MTLRTKLHALSAPLIVAGAVALSSTPAVAAPTANTVGLNASRQLSALNVAIKASPSFYPGRTNKCSLVTSMLASQPGLVMAGNFRDADGNCYVWLNLRQSGDLTRSEICKLGLHEMGHLNGLQHASDPADVMYSPFNPKPTPAPCVAPTAAKVGTHTVRARIATETTCPDSSLAPDATDMPRIAAAVLCLLNVERAHSALPPLSPSALLSSASQPMADRMVGEQFFSHETPDGLSLTDRIGRTGYLPRSDRWVVGENLAWGSGALATPQAIVDGWMNSPGHRANILASDYRDVGLGVAMGSPLATRTGGATYVTDFGVRPPARAKHPRRRPRHSTITRVTPA